MDRWTEFEGYKIEIEDNIMVLMYEGGMDWNYVAINLNTQIISTSEKFWEVVNEELARGIFLHEIGHLHHKRETNINRYNNDMSYRLEKELEADEYCLSRGGAQGLIKFFNTYQKHYKNTENKDQMITVRKYRLERLLLERF